MKNTCKNIAVFFLVLGFVVSLIVAFYSGIKLSYDNKYADIVISRDWTKTFLAFGIGMLITTIPYAIFQALSEILENQDYIIMKICDIEQKNAKIQKEYESVNVTKYGQWKCSACGRVNDSYVGTCACGKNKE